MTTHKFKQHSSSRRFAQRFGPALILAALTSVAILFVISSLHGCRRRADLNTSGELIGKGVVQLQAGVEAQRFELRSNNFPPSKAHDSTRRADARNEPVVNPAEADAFEREDYSANEPITRAEPSERVMSPLEPVRDEPVVTEAVVEADYAPFDVKINKVLAATAVKRRRPVEPGERFEANGESVWAWASVRNTGPSQSHVWMIWKHEGTVRSRVRLNVGQSPRWRTWSRFRMRAKHVGQWSVETTDADGVVLDTLEFEVVPDEAATTARTGAFEAE